MHFPGLSPIALSGKVLYNTYINIRKLGDRMNLTEIKNMDKNELLEYLDLYNVEAYPDESKRSLRLKAIDLFWALKDNNGFAYETVQSF
jgi:hypothetical protein